MQVPAPDALAQEFVQFSVQAGVLRFGEFKTKAGRLSPYFFNAGLFDDGAKLGRLAEFYARRLLASGLAFDMLLGPAYKGITLAAAVAIELARAGRNVPYAYNRKEAKDHGEGGVLVGSPVRGRVLIIDDVITPRFEDGEVAASTVVCSRQCFSPSSASRGSRRVPYSRNNTAIATLVAVSTA